MPMRQLPVSGTKSRHSAAKYTHGGALDTRMLTGPAAGGPHALAPSSILRVAWREVLWRLERDGHDDGSRRVGAFDQFDLLDRLRPLGEHRQRADLLAPELVGEFRIGDVNPAHVLAPLFPVFQPILFPLPSRVL